MISWIQTTFHKHFRVIFLVLLAVLIVSFVFTIGAPGIGQGEREVRAREFFGANLSSPDDQQTIFGDASLSVFLQAGYDALQQEQLQFYALQRFAGLHLANELNLPNPDATQLGEFIKTLRAFAGPTGTFDPAAYARFRDNLATNPQVTEADVARVISDDYRYQKVTKLLGGPGYVLDGDVAQQLARADSTWTLDVATVDYTTFSPEITPSDEALRTFFDANTFRYEVPPQVRVRYAAFQATSYLSQVTVTPAEVRAYYDANPARFPKPVATSSDPTVPKIDLDSATSTDAEADFTVVRAQVESALRLDRARRLASQAASDFTVAMFDAQLAADQVPAYFTQRGLTLTAVPPFPRNAVPGIFGGSPQIGNEAFKLGLERPFSDALPVPGGAVVLVWEETLPARTPDFAEANDAVAADYAADQKRQRFLAAGRDLRAAVSQQVAAGVSFADAVKSAADTAKLTTTATTYAPFTRRDPPEALSDTVLSTLDRLGAGDTSELLLSGDTGYLVHVAAQVKPELGSENPRFVEVRDQMAQFNAAQNSNAYLRHLVDGELAKSAPATAAN